MAFQAAAASSPPGGDGQGVSVRLELPWTTLVKQEDTTFRYILENASEHSIPIAIPRNEHGLAVTVGGQAFLSAKLIGGDIAPFQAVITDKPYRVEQAQWPPISWDGNEMESWTKLPPGQRLAWDQSRIDALYFDVLANSQLKSIQAHWLVGPDRWVSSDAVDVKVLPMPKSEWNQVFEAEWSPYGRGTDTRTGTAHTVAIEGKLYLFWQQRARIAEVHPEDDFEYQIDKDGTNMEVTISGPSGVRKVYVHLRHRCVRDTPWPIGPVSLFAPEPEPIPQAELAALRAEIGLNPDGSVPEGGLPPHPVEDGIDGNPESRNSKDREDKPKSIITSPVTLIISLVGLVIIFLLLRRIIKSTSRTSHSRSSRR